MNLWIEVGNQFVNKILSECDNSYIYIILKAKELLNISF